MNEGKKILLAEALIMTLFNLFGDAIDAGLNFIALAPGIGLITLGLAPFSSFFFFAVTEFWLIMRGGMGIRQQATVILGNLADMVPFISALPTKTVAVLVSIYMINHPKIAQLASAGIEKLKSTGETVAAAVEPVAASESATAAAE